MSPRDLSHLSEGDIGVCRSAARGAAACFVGLLLQPNVANSTRPGRLRRTSPPSTKDPQLLNIVRGVDLLRSRIASTETLTFADVPHVG